MTSPTRTQATLIGAFLLAIGFLAGYLTGDRPPGPPPRHAPPPQCQRDDRAMAMDWRSSAPFTTVIVMENGQPVRIEQSGGPLAIADTSDPVPPVEGGNHDGLLLAVLLLSLMPVVTWAALAWNRRRTNYNDPFADDPRNQEFVPRRDD